MRKFQDENLSSSSKPVQIMKMSSIYLVIMRGLFGCDYGGHVYIGNGWGECSAHSCAHDLQVCKCKIVVVDVKVM